MKFWILILDSLSLFLSYRRSLAFASFLAKCFLKLNPSFTNRNVQVLQTALPWANLSKRKQIFLNSQQQYFSFFVSYRFFASRSLAHHQEVLNKISIEGKHHLKTHTTKQVPIILVSMHLGDFMNAFLKLALSMPSDKQIGILKWMPETKKEQAAYQKFEALGLTLRVFRLREKPGAELLRFLRQANVLITMFDISEAFIKTVEVEFLGKPTYIPVGPAQLALATKAALMPFYVKTKASGQVLVFDKAISTRLFLQNNKNLSENSQVISQQIAHCFEKVLTHNPESWHFWPLLEYLWKK